jgi:hypothetical protein
MTDKTKAAHRETNLKSRLLASVADIRHYIRHHGEPENCPGCAAFDELQSAAMALIREYENIESGVVELSDCVDSWAYRRNSHD